MPDLSWLVAQPIAHRGLHDMNNERWENTLTAFRAAASRGYAVECDVHLSADGVPMVFHDEELQRLTGVEGKIWQRTAADLGTLTVGPTSDRIPTLAETVECIAGRVPVIVELKGSFNADEELVGRVAEVLNRYRGKAAIMSFEHRFIREFARHAAGIPGGLTAQGTGDRDLEDHFSMLAHPLAFISYAVEDLPNRFVHFVRQCLSMPVIAWTVRDREGLNRTRLYADQITFEGFEP